MLSDYWELECFIWGHGAVAQRAGIKGEKLAGRPNRRKQDTCHSTEVTRDQFQHEDVVAAKLQVSLSVAIVFFLRLFILCTSAKSQPTKINNKQSFYTM